MAGEDAEEGRATLTRVPWRRVPPALPKLSLACRTHCSRSQPPAPSYQPQLHPGGGRDPVTIPSRSTSSGELPGEASLSVPLPACRGRTEGHQRDARGEELWRSWSGAPGADMTEPTSKKQGFKKCRSATFSIDGFSFTIGKRRGHESVRVCVCVRKRRRGGGGGRYCGWIDAARDKEIANDNVCVRVIFNATECVCEFIHGEQMVFLT